MGADDFNHYMPKTAITRAIIEGLPGVALCGDTFTPESQGAKAIPGSETASRELEVCPECELFFSALREDAEEKTEVNA